MDQRRRGIACLLVIVLISIHNANSNEVSGGSNKNNNKLVQHRYVQPSSEESIESFDESDEEPNSFEKQLKHRYPTEELKRAVFSAWAGKRSLSAADSILDNDEKQIVLRYLMNSNNNAAVAAAGRHHNNENQNQVAYKKAFAPWAGKRDNSEQSEYNSIGHNVRERRRPWGGYPVSRK